MKKIILIGPVYPYKGGISHYTTLLYRVLSEKFDVKMISYKMQYPTFLFKRILEMQRSKLRIQIFCCILQIHLIFSEWGDMYRGRIRI